MAVDGGDGVGPGDVGGGGEERELGAGAGEERCSEPELATLARKSPGP